jgi:polar amino acid transport system permease protein
LAVDSLWKLACDKAPDFLTGAVMTLYLTWVAIAAGALVGALLALGRVYGNRPLYWICTGYVEFVRGTPLLVQLLLIYYGLPSLEVRLDALLAGMIGLGLNSAAYQAEYFRGAIQSIRAGQTHAALAIGMSRAQVIRYVIWPQAVRLVIPPWSNELIYTLKYSSAVYFISISPPELMTAGRLIAAKNFRFFEVYLIVAFIYLVLVLGVTKVLDLLEERLRIPGFERIAR